jgi:hypothetical protein
VSDHDCAKESGVTFDKEAYLKLTPEQQVNDVRKLWPRKQCPEVWCYNLRLLRALHRR